jgi:low temperature requirement protein LtrA
MATQSGPGSAASQFRRWFWRPPRAHGEIETKRRVSFLELFDDLVDVVVIAQASHELAGSVSFRG